MGRILPLTALFSIMLYIVLCDEIILYKNGETLIMIVMLAMSGGVLQFLIRNPKEHCFVNALPVTKAQQWKCMYMALLTMLGIVYAVYIFVTYMQCHNDVIVFREVLISGIVKCCTAVFVLTLVLWILGHTDFHFPVGFIVCTIMMLFGMPAVGTVIQKAFNTGSNNFVYALKTYWWLMTVPVKAINDAATEYGEGIFTGFTFDNKITVTVIYLAVIIALTVVLAFLAKNNYSKLPLEKNMNKGYAKKFPKVLIAVYVSLSVMGVLCLGVKLIDKVILETKTSNDYFYVGEIPDEVHKYSDAIAITVSKDGKSFYKGVVYENYSEQYMFKYEIYDVDFPKEYLYVFILNTIISLAFGIAEVIIPNRKTIKRGVTE